jgi:hypothetical protein
VPVKGLPWFKCSGVDFLWTLSDLPWTKEKPAPAPFMRMMAAAICSTGTQADWPERRLSKVWAVSRRVVDQVKEDVGWDSDPWVNPQFVTKMDPNCDHRGDQPPVQNQQVTPTFATKTDPKRDQPVTTRARALLTEEESKSREDSLQRESEPTPAPKAEPRRRGFFTPPRDLPPEPIQVDLSQPSSLPPHQRINLAWNESLIAAGIRSRYITREINAPVDSRLTEDPDETCRLIPIFIRLATITAGGWIRAPAPRWEAFVERWAGELSAWDGDENHAPGCGRKLDEVRRGRDNRSPIEREPPTPAAPEDPDWHLRELPWPESPLTSTAAPISRTSGHTALRPV